MKKCNHIFGYTRIREVPDCEAPWITVPIQEKTILKEKLDASLLEDCMICKYCPKCGVRLLHNVDTKRRP